MPGCPNPHFHLTLSDQPMNRIVAGKGILFSAIATGLLSFVTIILFLFCTPDFDVLFSLNAPQPFVQLYALALGKGGATFMTVIAVIGLVLVRGLGCFVIVITDHEKSNSRTLVSLSWPPLDLYLPSPVMVSFPCQVGLARWMMQDNQGMQLRLCISSLPPCYAPFFQVK